MLKKSLCILIVLSLVLPNTNIVLADDITKYNDTSGTDEIISDEAVESDEIINDNKIDEEYFNSDSESLNKNSEINNISGYTLSPEYMSGTYYQNYKSLSLSGNQADDIVSVARSQVGYREGALNGFGTNGKNITEYGRYTGTNGYAWCASFLSWCAYMAGIPTSIVNNNASAKTKSFVGQYFAASSMSSGNLPKKGDILYENFGGSHVELVAKDAYRSGSYIAIDIIGGNSGTNADSVVSKTRYVQNTSNGSLRWGGTILGFTRPNYNNAGTVAPPPVVNNPRGVLDAVVGEENSVFVRGWAFDQDNTNEALAVHVYVGGPAGSEGADSYGITANQERTDVNDAFSCGNNHGFSASIPTDKLGDQDVYVYAINIGSGDNVLLGSQRITINGGPKPPEISNVSVTDITPEGYTVNCRITDNRYIKEVKFPSWTLKDDQDDLIWHVYSDNLGLDCADISYRIYTKDHNNAMGEYLTHIYVWDIGGNVACYGVPVVNIEPAATEAEITNVSITNIDNDFYTVNCHVEGNGIIYDAEFPTWTPAWSTESNEPIIKWYHQQINAKSADISCTVNRNDFNSVTGEFTTHIYTYDYKHNILASTAAPTIDMFIQSSVIDTPNQDENYKDLDVTVQGWVVGEKYNIISVQYSINNSDWHDMERYQRLDVDASGSTGNDGFRATIPKSRLKQGDNIISIRAVYDNGLVRVVGERKFTAEYTVPHYETGDLNDDGEIDSIDSLKLLKYVAGLDVSMDLEGADINGDGAVNSLDSLRLLRFVAGLITTLN